MSLSIFSIYIVLKRDTTIANTHTIRTFGKSFVPFFGFSLSNLR